MDKRIPDYPKYICYLSNSKVDNLFSQITNMDVDKIQKQSEIEHEGNAQIEIPIIMQLLKGGMSFGRRKKQLNSEEGQLNHIQKLRQLLSFCHEHGLIQDFNQVIRNTNLNTPVLYTFSGSFSCKELLDADTDFLKAEKAEADQYIQNDEPLKRIGRMVELKTEMGDKTLVLACSTKYFSDMGSSRIKNELDGDCFEVVPHSGNYYFFRGKVDAVFEAIFILNGQRGDCLCGSPVVLFNEYSSDLII